MHMSRWRVLALSMLMTAQAAAPGDATFWTVSYIEVLPSSRGAALAAFSDYRTAGPGQDGNGRLELFEQSGRPGHFALVEAWSDQQAFDARDTDIRSRLLAALQPIRLSDYDQRPYRTLTLDSRFSTASPPAVYVLTHVDVSPDPQVPLLLQRLAEASRQEEGSVRFDVLQHAMRSNHFTVIEAWRDQNALDAHAAANDTRQYRDDLAPFLGSPLDERVFLRLD